MQSTESPGQVIRVLRDRAGITARELADRAGVSESYLSRVENGVTEPSDAWIGHVARIAASAIAENAPRKGKAA
ncbi:helix-turn-helix domain-containing protein [Herbiconiux solani]|uniref:helix-turn-helix domain-containing protein n=1 Tax=Herbiconiux solani TaxID=661329 RepID=UPI000826C6B0